MSKQESGRVGLFLRACFSKLDPVLLTCSTVLTLISLITLCSCTGVVEVKQILIQAAAAVVGFVCMVALANVDYDVVLAQKLHPLFYFASVALMIFLLLFGTGVGTNKSWITFSFLPFGIQPSEFIKSALALTFAFHLTKVRDRINRPRVLLGLLVHAGSIIGWIVLTGDLGVAMIFLFFILLMLFCAGLSLWYFAGGLLLTGIAAPFVWKFLAEYQRQRILIGFRPELDPTGYGYQALLSRDAIMAGGLGGAGLDSGAIYKILPAAHTDFMFATICEKLGFVGGFTVIVLLLILILRTIQIAWRSKKAMGSYLAVGIAGCLAVQMIENIGMCFAVLPVVGITLPFISYGGSSMLGGYLMAGLLHSICAHDTGSLSKKWK